MEGYSQAATMGVRESTSIDAWQFARQSASGLFLMPAVAWRVLQTATTQG